jgi:RimJ/RimL family protein N-acetyltransferase
MPWAEPVTLEGAHVRMEPLDLARHWDGLLAIGLEPSLWRWTIAQIASADALRAYLDEALREAAAGRALPFATIDRASGRVAGCTRFGNIDAHHRRMEIGWTWVGLPWQRTHINTNAKYLMLRHAFETLRCGRVELKTDARNDKSRTAMERMGAQFEGVLRQHMLRDDGTWRDSAYYSVLDHEWPAVKARLEGFGAA